MQALQGPTAVSLTVPNWLAWQVHPVASSIDSPECSGGTGKAQAGKPLLQAPIAIMASRKTARQRARGKSPRQKRQRPPPPRQLSIQPHAPRTPRRTRTRAYVGWPCHAPAAQPRPCSSPVAACMLAAIGQPSRTRVQAPERVHRHPHGGNARVGVGGAPSLSQNTFRFRG